MAGSDITIEILKDIRAELRKNTQATRGTTERIDSVESTLNRRFDSVEATLNDRIGAVELTLLDLAEQQRFVVRYNRALSERDSRAEGRLAALETRVDKLESK